MFCWDEAPLGIQVPGFKGVKQRHDREVARLHDGARLDLPNGRHGDLGASGELFLSQPCSRAKSAQPFGQPIGLVRVAAVRASSPSRAVHTAILR